MDLNIEKLNQQFHELWEVLKEPIFTLKDNRISASGILLSLLVIFITIKLSKLIGRMANRALSRKDVDSGVRDSIEKFVRYSVLCIGVMLSLDNLGISINSLAAVGAILMVGIGFGLQNITQNFISGIILLIERPIKVGDIIKVGSVGGKVVDINVRSTHIQTRDGITILVPNSRFISEDVVNDSYSGNIARYHISVGVSYSSDSEQVQKILRDAALKNPHVMKDPAPMAVFSDFGDSALNFDLRYWSAELWLIDVIASDIRSHILNDLRVAGISIPFPQRDIHIIQSQDTPQPK